MPNRKILVNDVRVRGVGKTDVQEDPIRPSSTAPPKLEKVSVRERFYLKPTMGK